MKNKKPLWLLVLIVVVCFGLVACTPDEPEPLPAEVTITLDTVTKQLDVYDTFKLTATVSGTDEAVTWQSSNEAVATVTNQGVVTAAGEGSATITASVADKSATCALTVTNSHTAPVIRAERTDVAIDLNATYDLVVETLFKGNVISDVTYTWTLCDGAADDIASVTGTATGATIKGLKYGDTSYVVTVTTHGATVSKQINVSVRNSAISFDTSKFVLQDGTYSATLALVNTDDIKITLDPQVKVLENNVEVADATLAWTSSDSNIVAVENGKFVAKAEGVVTISTSYQNNNISVKVSSIRPQIKLADVVEIELSRIAPLTFDAVQGTIGSVTFNDTEILEKVQDGAIVLKESALPTEYSKMGKGDLVIQTNLAIYKADAEIYTMIIRNVADYDAFQTLMFDDAKTDWIWGGYFVLGNDIDAQGATLTNKLDYATLTATAGENGYFYVAGMYGFNGIFDGRGYAISNATFTGGDAGIIGVTLHDEGVVRNLSLLNVTQDVYGLISRCGGGLVENIYATIASVTKVGNQWLSVGAFSPSQSTGFPKLKNSVVIYLDGAITNTEHQVALGGYHLCYGSLSNAYAIGAPSTIEAIDVMGTQGNTEPDVYGSYATAAEFAKDVTVNADNGWDMSYWTTIKGIPVPTALKTTFVAPVPVASVAQKTYTLGSDVTVSVGVFGKVVLSDTAIDLGITVNGNVISVPATVPDKTVVNFSVVNVMDETKKVELSFVADSRTTEQKKITTPVEVELNNADKPTTTIDLGLEGTFESITAKIGSVTLTNATVEEGKLVITAADIPNSIWGNQTITANIATSEHFYEVEISVTVITKVIRNVADYDAFQTLMFDDAKTDWIWGGYFVLGNDIDAQGATLTNKLSYSALTSVKPNGNWWDVRVCGFNGIFDGKGYAISNATFEGNDAGLIGYGMNTYGVVRNLSLLNVTQKTTAGLIARMGGKTENVFITIKSVAVSGSDSLPVAAFLADGCAGSYSIHNSVVIYLDGAFASNPTNVVAIAGVHTGWGVLNSVYAIGAPATVPAIKDLGNQGGDPDVYGSYATAAEFAKDVTVNADNGWDMSYWTTIKGIPVPTALKTTFVAPVPVASVAQKTYTLGSDVTVSVGVFGKVVLSDTAIDLGITVNGNVISVPTTVPNGSTINFSVVNVMDETKKVDLSFVADSRTTENFSVSTRVEVELNNSTKTTHDFALPLDGTWQSVEHAKMGELTLDNVTFADGKLTIDLTKIPNSVWGERNITVYITTSEHFYNVTIPVTVITKVIRNLADFDKYQDIISADAADDWIWGGYFVLGNDINANGATINAGKVNGSQRPASISGANGYSGWTYGFNGIFDGRGYAIDNGVWEVNASGLVGMTMHNNGIVRNLSLTNVTHNGSSGLICFQGGGTIENLYVTVKSIANGGQWTQSGIFYANGVYGAPRVKNSVVIYFDGAFAETPAYMFALGNIPSSYLTNVYAIGVPATVKATNDDVQSNSYATAAEFAAAVTVNAENGWDMSYWTTIKGIPVPTALKTTFVAPVPVASVAQKTYTLGSDVTVSVGVFGKVVLSDTATDLGITVNGNVISVPTTVPNGSTINFSVVNVMDETKKVDLSFVADSRTTENFSVSTRVEVELNNSTKTTHDFALPLDGTWQSVEHAKMGELTLDNVTFADGKLTIDLTKIPNSVWGERNITVYITTSEHFYNVTIPVTVITKVIRNVADYDAFQDIMFADAKTDWIWGGYFVLGNDIDAQGATLTNKLSNGKLAEEAPANENWWLAWSYGFNGIFDGKGYAISNAKFDGDTAGIIGATLNNEGVVRNLSLLNVTQNVFGLISCYGGGKVENVYATIASVTKVGGDGYQVGAFITKASTGLPKLKNSVVIYLDGAITNTEDQVALGGYHLCYGSLSNAYAIGAPSTIEAIDVMGTQGSTDPDVYGSYATAAEFAAAVTVNAENGWDMSYWTTDANGAPIPQSLVSD